MEADPYLRPCFDSSVFIGGLGDGEICGGIKRKVIFDWLWEYAKAGKFEVYISALALAEVYKTKRHTSQATASPILDEFLNLIEERFVNVIEIDRQTGLDAHALCRRYSQQKLWPNDALHLACALRARCDVLIAWDRPIVNITHERIRIEEPCIYERNIFNEKVEIASQEEIDEYETKTKRR